MLGHAGLDDGDHGVVLGGRCVVARLWWSRCHAGLDHGGHAVVLGSHGVMMGSIMVVTVIQAQHDRMTTTSDPA